MSGRAKARAVRCGAAAVPQSVADTRVAAPLSIAMCRRLFDSRYPQTPKFGHARRQSSSVRPEPTHCDFQNILNPTERADDRNFTVHRSVTGMSAGVRERSGVTKIHTERVTGRTVEWSGTRQIGGSLRGITASNIDFIGMCCGVRLGRRTIRVKEGDERPIGEVDRVDDVDAGGPIERRALSDDPRRGCVRGEFVEAKSASRLAD